MKDAQNSIQSLIAQGRIRQALDLLTEQTASDTELRQETLQLSARLSEIERQQRLNIADAATIATERNRITLAILEIAGRLQESGTAANKPDSGQSEKPTIIQQAEKIYNINHIDQADFN